MGVTLAEAEVATRIRQKYLAALEADEWDLLPGEVVGRGFLRNYSTYLGLEPTEMIERRRAVADDSLAAVLVNTSAGSALPPERKVDYRPKDVALKDEGDELETPRQINWAPLLALVMLAVFGGLVFFVVTQLGPQMGEMAAAAQQQLAALQAPAAETAPRAAATLPPNLTANTDQAPAAVAGAAGAANAAGTSAGTSADTADTAADAGAGTAPAGDTNSAAAPAAVATTPPVAVEPTPAPAGAPPADAAAPSAAAPSAGAAAEGGLSLGDLPPAPAEEAAAPAAGAAAAAPAVPTPAPAAPAAADTAAATVNTGANLRSGPGTDYPILAGLPAGQAITITGRSADGTWFALSDGSWVFAELVSNPPADAPVVAAPPVPAPAEAAPAEAAPAEAAPAEAAPAEAAPAEAAPATNP